MVASLSMATATTYAQDPLEALRSAYPEVRVHNAGRHFHYFYGTPMTSGQTEAEAAENFLREHGGVFGGPLAEGRPELSSQWTIESRSGRITVFSYKQRIRGKEVDGSGLRVKVRRGLSPRVDHAAARFAGEPTAGSETPVLPAEIATLLVNTQSGIPGLVVEGSPQVVVLRGTATRPDAWCWRVSTREGEGLLAKRRTHYVDTASPRILLVRNHFGYFQPPTTGIVEGAGVEVGPPWYPYMGPTTDLVVHRIPGVSVQGTFAPPPTLPVESVFANSNGEFSLANGASGQGISVDASLERAGQGFHHQVGTGTPPYRLSVTDSGTTGATFPLELTSADSNFLVNWRIAQIDTVLAARMGKNFIHQYVIANVPTIVYIFANNAPASFACGTWNRSGSSFIVATAPETNDRWNCGSYSVVGHELGHNLLDYIDHDLLEQSGFHEGFADTLSNMIRDHSVQGPMHNRDGTNIRDDPTASHIDCQYPLTQYSSHQHCGCGGYAALPLISGPWARIRTGFKQYTGSGLEYARETFGNWALITLGGDDCQSGHPGTLIEVQNSLVQDDAGLTTIISDSFAAHNICIDGPCN